MSSDSEIDGIERFQSERERKLYEQAGLDRLQHEDLEMSDEEVMGIESGGDNNDEDEGQEQYYEQAEAEKDDDENWGDTRDNYFGGEDDLGAEEGASEEEEEEALRLQQKQLAEMEDADFVDEDDLEGWKSQAAEDLGPVEETPVLDASSMSAEERRELIETRFPVILLLANELEKCQKWDAELTSDASLDEHFKDVGKATLQTYMGMIYSFFALFSERVNQGITTGLNELEEHPVHEGILTARQLWQDFQRAKAARASGASLPGKAGLKPDSEHISDAESLGESESEGPVRRRRALGASDHDSRASQTSDSNANVSDFSASESESESESEDARVAARDGDDDENDDDDDDNNKNNNDDDDDEFSIAKPTAKRPQKQLWSVVGDYDEAADTIEQQQRAKSKQSLRFYTSQIGKSEAAKNSDTTGDMDIPYREREFERRQRLMQAAQKRGQEARDQLGDDFDDEDSQAMLDDDAEAEDGHASTGRSSSAYAQMREQRDSTKEKRRKEYSDAREAARAGRVAEYLAENPNADKRAINYMIEKNKGLTPRRKKENRNARVKKRARYEAAQKKLKGVRRVYEEPKGPYQGELTGIRKNLVHSNKFKN